MSHNPKIFYVNSNRAHKLLPLLSDQDYGVIYNFKDVLRIFRKRIKPLFVLIDSFGRIGFLGLIASMLLRSPLVIRLRGDFFEEANYRIELYPKYFSKIRYFISSSITKLFLSKSKGIIFNSYYLFTAFYLGKSYNNKLTTVVYNPFTPLKCKTDESNMKFDPKGFLLISATNMTLRPKVIYQLNRMLEIPSNMWEIMNLYWYVCGDGILRSEAQNLITKRCLADRIILTGRIENIEIYFKSCHVCIHLSRMDAFPNTTLEAMYYNLPVITNHDSCGTLEQVFHRKNGLVLNDHDNILDAIRLYKNDPELRKQHGRFGHNYVVNKFSISAQKEKMNDFVRKMSNNFGAFAFSNKIDYQENISYSKVTGKRHSTKQ